ncbi:hypothetical protein EVAR_51285_1 [Eumeta japonica]|uniref:Uncharacterized protein n=1 Tax=Eumeta variegata TaxID=151549 RepID=A0A4C1XQA3_EUMVA|nr:hypothetical protein EVAR_51285_1 [Eumeta japonica]
MASNDDQLPERKLIDNNLYRLISRAQIPIETISDVNKLSIETAAYKYLRKSFNNALPHPRTLSNWYGSVNAEPGFTKEAFKALELKSLNALPENPIICSLVFDEMSIRQQKPFKNEKVGFVNFGTGPQEEKATQGYYSKTYTVRKFSVPAYTTCRRVGAGRSPDQTPRSPVLSRSPSLATLRRPLPFTSASSTPPFERPRPVILQDFYQPRNQAQVESERGGVDGCGRTRVGHGGVADRAGGRRIWRQLRFMRINRRVLIKSSSATFADIHVSVVEDVPSSSRIFRMSSPTEALLDTESGSDSEYLDEVCSHEKTSVHPIARHDGRFATFWSSHALVSHHVIDHASHRDVTWPQRRDDSRTTFTTNFTTFNAIRDEFLVHPVDGVKYYDSPYDAFIDIFREEIMKRLMMELEGGHRNSVIKRRNPIEFGLVRFLLTSTLILYGNQRLMMEPEGGHRNSVIKRRNPIEFGLV